MNLPASKPAGRTLIKGHTVHSIKGRLRLTYAGLKYLYDESPEIAHAAAQIPFVKRARVTPATGSVLLEYDCERTDPVELREALDVIMGKYAIFVHQRHLEATGGNEEAEAPMSTQTLKRRLLLGGAALVLSNTFLKGRVTAASTVLSKLTSPQALVSYVLTLPMLKSAVKGIRTEKRPNADFLTVVSIIASLLLGNGNSALTILALSDIAEFMTSFTMERTRNSIKNMFSVDDTEVWKLLESGELERCDINSVKPSDKVVVHTGEKLPVDGIIVSGDAVVDQSAITGEFVPAQKVKGDEVYAGAVVKSGNLTVRATKVGDQTVVSRIISMVESNELQKAPIQRYADRFSNYLVPLNFLASAAVYLVTRNYQKALKMLVIDYSCGIKLSTATAFSAAINAAVKRGILIKGGVFLEHMASANTVLFDKTGTVTEGRPKVTGMHVLTNKYTQSEILAHALAAEETSTHPLASAILRYGREQGVSIPSHEEVITEVSRGSRTVVDGKIVRVGNMKYMTENGVICENPLPDTEGAIASYVGIDDVLAAMILSADRPRENVRRAVNSLRFEGVGDIELLTGDMTDQARAVCEAIGADSFRAELLPEQKAQSVLKLQAGGNTVIMVGDGINDAPALSYADVGISLGSKSTDIAMETSDVIIGRDDPMTIPALRRLASRTMRIVNQNFAMVIGINTVGLILGAASNISVLMSAMLHNSSTILVVANSLRLMFSKIDGGDADE